MMPPKELFEGGPGVVSIEVRVCLDANGAIWSIHRFSPEDTQTLMTWPGGGTRHIGHALLTEAVRREAFSSTLVLLGQEPDCLKQWVEADEEGKKEIEDRLALTVQTVIEKTTMKLSHSSVQEILEMLVRQIPKTA